MSLWSMAKFAAENTPEHRNRTADFFRAAAISIVILGHWLVSVPQYMDGELRFTELLIHAPWTQYLTWVVQVMPIFFFVGGFSNAASWSSARRDPAKKAAWQASRLRRLLMPLTPLVVLWAGLAFLGGLMDIDAEIIRNATRAALIPIWFLAVYIVVSVAVPATYAAWERFGIWSAVALILAAALVDFLAFAHGVEWLRWVNYAFIWLSMHQLGYWWHSGIANRTTLPLAMIGVGVALLLLLTGPLGYPVAMISVPGAEISNSRPPTFAMLAIGFAQAGLILLAEARVARWLLNSKPWAIVILVSQRIMTIYLWHLTALLILVGLSLLMGGFGLKLQPGSPVWWLTRPIFILIMALFLLPLTAIFGRLEAGSRAGDGGVPGPTRSVIGAVIACAGVALLALGGTWSDNAVGVAVVPVLLTLGGVALATVTQPTKS
jgi:hypothetical protein